MDENGGATFVREIVLKSNFILRIHQSAVGDVGCVVWDAALVLIKFLEMDEFFNENGTHTMENRTVLELGAGTGAVGLAASVFGAEVTLTDLDDHVALMNKNIVANRSVCKGPVKAACLRWGQNVELAFPKPSYILCADCVYYDQSLEPLVKTINDLSNAETIVLFCYEERIDKNELHIHFTKLIGKNFNIERIPRERMHPQFCSPDLHILKLTRRS
uniref:Methyltransferase small domain-containing protein n=1 Tax=Strigamia maritima TaxID=126957 RepID=T1JII1_STRMM